MARPGKNFRRQVLSAFNVWLEVDGESLNIIDKVVGMLHNASLLYVGLFFHVRVPQKLTQTLRIGSMTFKMGPNSDVDRRLLIVYTVLHRPLIPQTTYISSRNKSFAG